jgi:hypothetical protein
MSCTTCGVDARTIREECRICYVYRRRTGKQRPEGLIVRKARREFELAELRRWTGLMNRTA